MNIYQDYLNTLQKHSQKIALQAADSEISFSQLDEMVSGVAQVLGRKSKEPIGILAGNSPAFVSALVAVMRCEGVVVPLNAMLSPPEISQQLQHAEIRTLLVSKPFQKLAEAATRGLKQCQCFVIEDLPIVASSSLKDTKAAELVEDELALIIYTSGTTDNPKGVMLSHKNFLSNFTSFSKTFALGTEDNMLVVLPLFHCFAFTVQMLSCLVMGSKLILFPLFNPKKVLTTMREEKNLVFLAVPSMYGVLAALGKDKCSLKENLKLVVSGGGPMPSHVQEAFEKSFAVEILEGYGLTEAAPAVSCNRPGKKNRRATIGQPIAGVEVEIQDEAGKVVSRGIEGEIVVRGPNIMQGYYKNTRATAETITTKGWLRTGDLAVMDEDDYLFLKGRRKELIICAGENIHPREVAEVIGSHPKIMEAAVIGIPHKTKTEVPKAFLVPLPGIAREALNLDEIKQYVRERLASHKVPQSWVILDALPKNATGKVDFKLLCAQ